jgi:hypothetical protein
MTRPIFFCHIPKTAGTSVRYALQARFDRRFIVPNDTMIADNGGLYPPLEACRAAITPQTRLLQGHYPYSARTLLDDPITIVSLREPVARTISHIKHRIRHEGLAASDAYASLDGGELPALVAENLMTRMLIGRAKREKMVGYIEAIAMLETVTILGIAERMNAFAKRLGSIGITLPPDERHNAGDEDFPLTERQLSTLRRHNQLDMLVYDYACEMLGFDNMPSSVKAA